MNLCPTFPVRAYSSHFHPFYFSPTLQAKPVPLLQSQLPCLLGTEKSQEPLGVPCWLLALEAIACRPVLEPRNCFLFVVFTQLYFLWEMGSLDAKWLTRWKINQERRLRLSLSKAVTGLAYGSGKQSWIVNFRDDKDLVFFPLAPPHLVFCNEYIPEILYWKERCSGPWRWLTSKRTHGKFTKTKYGLAGTLTRTETLSLPADSPKMVTEPGSPPKLAMLFWIHLSAATWSKWPQFPGLCSSPVLQDDRMWGGGYRCHGRALKD